MTKHLATALLGTVLLAGSAMAQATAPSTNAPRAAAPATAPATNNVPAANQRGGNANRPMYQMRQGQWLSSKLVGLNVYNNNNETIGDINDLIVGSSGDIEAVVIGVGGFLGMGEHSVAVPFKQVRFSEERRSPPQTAAARDATTRGGAATSSSAPVTGTTALNGRSANTNSGSVGTNNAAQPTGAQGSSGTSAYRGFPDHATVNLTKEQLQALPHVRAGR